MKETRLEVFFFKEVQLICSSSSPLSTEAGLWEQVCDELWIPLNYRCVVTQQRLRLLYCKWCKKKERKPKIHLFGEALLGLSGQDLKVETFIFNSVSKTRQGNYLRTG